MRLREFVAWFAMAIFAGLAFVMDQRYLAEYEKCERALNVGEKLVNCCNEYERIINKLIANAESPTLDTRQYLELAGRDEDGKIRMTNGRRYYWMDIDPNYRWWSPAFPEKKIVYLTDWFTFGEEAQQLQGDKLEAAWEAHHPGVWKMRYSKEKLEELFPNCVYRGTWVKAHGL